VGPGVYQEFPVKPITAGLLVKATGCSLSTAGLYAGPLRETCALFEIWSPERLAAFLAQTGHESAGFTRTKENLNYSASGLLDTWPSRFTSVSAPLYARQPERIANYVYGGRMGNTAPGDGWNYRGRGLIQTTGKANYEAVTEALLEHIKTVPDFVEHPEILEQPRWAALSAGSYWNDHELNALADAGHFDRITKVINGGQNGREDRVARFLRAMRALTA